MEDARDPIAAQPKSRKARGPVKLTFALDGDRLVVLIGVEPTMEAVLAAAVELQRRLNAARRQNVGVQTAQDMFRDQARN